MEACLPRPEKCPREFKEEVHYLRGGPNVLSGQTFQFEIENPEPFPGDSWKYKTRGTTFNKPTTKSMIENDMISGKMVEFRTENNMLLSETVTVSTGNPQHYPIYINTTRRATLDKLTTKSMIETTRIPRPTFNNSPIPNKPQIDDFVFLLLGLLINHLSEF